MALRTDGNHQYSWMKNKAIGVRELDPTAHLAPQHSQLMTERGILRFKAAVRLERQGQQSKKET
jgi:hypothetical protein